MDLERILEDQNPWWREPAARIARVWEIKRELQAEVAARLRRLDDRRGVVVVGPRQVGKTVLLRQTADGLLDEGWPPANVTYLDFSDDRLTEAVTPRQVAAIHPPGTSQDRPRVLLFDEITRGAGRWDLWLKQAVDAGGFRIAVSDSAASLLRSGGQESGAGRWDELLLESLSYREFVAFHARSPEEARDLDLVRSHNPNLVEQYLALGGFPEHVRTRRRDYDYTAVRERLRADIVEKALLWDLAPLDIDLTRVKTLFVYLIQESGGQFKASNRASDLGADRRSVAEWLRRLEETALLVSLPRYQVHATARARSSPKIYAADPGLVAAFSPLPARDESVRAKVFEAAVFRHLRQLARRQRGELYYYRDREGLELDFLLLTDPSRVAVEVTSSARPKASKVEKLLRAAKQVEARQVILVHGGFLDEGDNGESGPLRRLPLERFLLAGPEILEAPS